LNHAACSRIYCTQDLGLGNLHIILAGMTSALDKQRYLP
jgi:hypothetical protein